jgi:hypothetical protein
VNQQIAASKSVTRELSEVADNGLRWASLGRDAGSRGVDELLAQVDSDNVEAPTCQAISRSGRSRMQHRGPCPPAWRPRKLDEEVGFPLSSLRRLHGLVEAQ